MFTLAHLSDIHLAPLPRPQPRDLFGKRVTGYLNWRRRRRFIHDRAVLDAIVTDLQAQDADHIAVTGDLVNIGLEAEYPPGRALLDSFGTPQTVSLVPGNHDIYVAASARFAERAWGPFMRGDDDATFPYLNRRGNAAIIGLSTGVATAPFQATGRLGPEQLAGLARWLDIAREEKLFRVVLLHHPPVSEAAAHKRLIDADALAITIAAHGAELILHGHDHRDMINWLPGPDGARVPAIGVPSASAAPGRDKDNAGYHLYRIDGEAGAWRCEMTVRAMDGDGVVKEVKRVML